VFSESLYPNTVSPAKAGSEDSEHLRRWPEGQLYLNPAAGWSRLDQKELSWRWP